MDSLNRLPYSVRKDECRLKVVELNKYVLEENLSPLKYFPKNYIPKGTAATFDLEENIVIFKKSLPIWEIVRNFLTMYLNGHVSWKDLFLVDESDSTYVN